MAAADPSPLASSMEKTNGAKLSRLLIDGGSAVLRKFFKRYHPPANLLADLNANYHTLNNLLRRRVLHKPQWGLLFPPGGAIPDSNTFDITLLFLLLTNICGLSPPPSGWHTKPPASDTSDVANLARIKFFRNKLYGHVTTTGIDTPTFSALWLEISAVLVAFGLPQAEVDRLKTEHCGEEDFIDVLFEWADSEEDIKSQLKDIHQSQIKVQQTVAAVHLTQLEDLKIRQDSKRKLDDVLQVQTETQQTVDEVRQAQSKTQQTVYEVRQKQLEDRGTIKDSNIKLKEVFQINTKTRQVLTNVRETQIHDSKVIQKISQRQTNTDRGVAKLLGRQKDVHQTLQETKFRVEESHEKLLRAQSEQFEALRQDLKETVEDSEGRREKHRENEILKKLAQIDTLKNVRYHADRYVEGTRLSIFAEVESWLNDRSSPNRVMVISGNAGMGKSVISAIMCKKMQEAGRLAGSHFCLHDRARHRNPRVMLQSLASQLCDFLPDYKKALVEKLSRNLGVEINNMEVKDLFEVLFEEPLAILNDPGLIYLMVIDGLDESEFQGRSELLDVIANFFQNLPLWIRFLVTTRPERNIAENLRNLNPLQLHPKAEKNMKDIHLCFEKQVSHLLQLEHQEIIMQALVQKSEGVMLYVHYLVDFIKKEVPVLTPELLDSTLPSGISSVYRSYFKRLETELCKELNVAEDQFLTFLSAVAVAREPLPLGFVAKLLLPGKSTSLLRRKVNMAIACVSALLPVQDDCIHFFHKSAKDWLIDESNYGQHHFSVDENECHKVLSKLCIDELDEVKRKGVDCAQFTDVTKYALRHGVQHMLQLEDARVCSLEEVVKKFVLDLDLVYAKLCVNVTAAFEDIVCVQKQAGIEELQRALNTLLVLLRKHVVTLEKLPHTIFQTVLNEGGNELSSEALNLLETKYCEMAYMEYLHKEDLKGRIQTKFECSAAVACFDVSPQLGYLVCECDDNTIQLWSLHTGKQLWKRDVMIIKDYYYQCYDDDLIYEPYRAWKNYHYYVYDDDFSYPPKSLYRSVVFHPTEDLVLPGILSHAYTYDGELRPLFLSSKCRFCICSISADKTKMLTDCTNDAKSIIMWSLTDGSEINRFSWDREIVSFAWSRDGRLLAISDLSGSIGLLDVTDGYRTLAQTTISEVCGIIQFSPDCRCLNCLVFNSATCDLFRLDVNMENDGIFSLDIFSDEVSYQPWEFESCNESESFMENDGNFPLDVFPDEVSYQPREFDSCNVSESFMESDGNFPLDVFPDEVSYQPRECDSCSESESFMESDGNFPLDVFPEEVSYQLREFESCSESGSFIENDGNFPLDVFPEEVSYQPWVFESCSESGFLFGDPFCFPSERDSIYDRQIPSLAFVLNEQSVLTVASGSCIIEMLQFDKLTKDSAGVLKTTVLKVVLSMNGEMLLVLTKTDDYLPTLRAWNISSGMFNPGKRVFKHTVFNEYNLLAVREGVLLQTSNYALELWNFELSECIRSWTDLGFIIKVIPISEERVACEVVSQLECEVERKVIIVDTTREGIVSTFTIHGLFLACNSKCHVIISDRHELQMQCGDVVLWKISQPSVSFSPIRYETFSPTEQYCIFADFHALYVLDVVLGKILRTLQPPTQHSFPINFECKFVSDEEYVTCLGYGLTGYLFQLFNIISGDLLSEIALESKVYSLTACPRERLIAIGFSDSKVNFKVLQVKLPGDKHSRKSKRVKPKE